MALRIFRLLSLLTIVDGSLSQWSKDGNTQTFEFAANINGSVVSINWIFQNGNRNITLFQCSSDNRMTCDAPDDKILDLYSANITSNASSIISMFTIKNVSLSLHNTRWFYIAESTVHPSFYATSRFDLQVFSPAQSSTCNEVKLINESNIQIYCWTSKVFPGSVCLFEVKTNVSTEYELKQGHFSYTQDQNLTTPYYQTTCTLVVSAAILGLGFHKFRVVMYPNITSDITEEMKMTSEYTSSIHLDYPRALLEPDCKVKGYIMENRQSNCTCSDLSNSFLPTQIKWLTNRTVILEKGTLIFIAKRNESYQCIISNQLNWTDQVDFKPNISYPPDIVSLNITKHVFDLCNDTNIFISGTCFVGEGNPEPLITLNILNSLMGISFFKHERQYIFNKTITNAGIYNISCLANSKEYSKNLSSITTVTIKGPAGIPNIFKAENEESNNQPNNLMKITKEDTITCESKGGYPILKNISLTCGHETTHVTNQDQASLTLNRSKVTNGKCECIVWQESKCLQNTSIVQFKFSEIPTDTDQHFEKIYLGVGVAAGCLLVISVLIVLISNLYQVQFKKNPSMADNLVNNEDIYFIKEEKSGIDMSIYPEYTNVVTTMSSAMEAPKNLQK